MPVVREGDVFDFEERAVFYITIGDEPCAVITGCCFRPQCAIGVGCRPAVVVRLLRDITDVGHGDICEVVVEDVVAVRALQHEVDGEPFP